MNKPRVRVDWTDEENYTVVYNIIHHLRNSPELSTSQVFSLAQEFLAPERRRHIGGFSQAPIILNMVLDTLLKGIPPIPPAFDTTPYQAQIESLQKELEKVKQELATEKSIPRLQPAEVLANAADHELFFHLMSRFAGRFASELAPKIPPPILPDVQQIQERLWRIESSIASGKYKFAPDLPVAPSPKDDRTYMPQVLVAGGSRQDFQRLQAALQKLKLRLIRLDISVPSKISVPKYDLFVLWSSGMPSEIFQILSGRNYKNSLIVSEPLASLAIAIGEAVQDLWSKKLIPA